MGGKEGADGRNNLSNEQQHYKQCGTEKRKISTRSRKLDRDI
jgi:hypothetical protein